MNKYITKGAIKPEKITELLIKQQTNPTNGGHSLFLGQVRNDIIDDKEVQAIDYSGYSEMIEKQTDKIFAQIYAEFEDVKDIYMLHSIGKVKTGEISLLVMTSGGHRIQVRKANAKLVDLIKEHIPIWGKEIFSDKTFHWKENKKL